MEWMLQVVDELDDAVGVVRHGLIGVNARIRVLWSGFGGIPAALRYRVTLVRIRP